LDQIRIPTEIDTPEQVLLWSMDEFVPFICFLVIGNLAGHVVIGCLVGAVVGHLYRRYKNTRPDGFLNHLLYWWAGWPEKGVTFVNPYRRKFLP
jgi:conjugal transfer pilus assembly protein TraL